MTQNPYAIVRRDLNLNGKPSTLPWKLIVRESGKVISSHKTQWRAEDALYVALRLYRQFTRERS